MPKLTLNAIGGHVNVQDPNPIEGVLSLQAIPGTPKIKDVTWSQLQRLRNQLTALEENGVLTYSIASTDLDARAEEPDLVGVPTIDALNSAAKPFSVGAGATTGGVVTGTVLHANQTKASVVMGDADDANGHITFEAIIPGTEGNEISVEIVDPGPGVESVAVVANKITITLDGGTSDFDSIATTVNAHATAKFMVKATKGGTGATVVTAEDETWLVDGQGAGVAISISDVACVISEVADDGLSITYDFDVSTLVALDTAVFMLRSGSKTNRLAVNILA